MLRSTCPWEGAEGAGMVQSAEGTALGGPKSRPQCLWGGHQENGDPGSHSFSWWVDERLSTSWKRRGSAGYKLELFPHEGSRTLQQITQRLCRVHPGRVSALTGLAQSLEQSGVNPELNLLWAGGQARDLLSSLPMWIFLWSYDLLDFS